MVPERQVHKGQWVEFMREKAAADELSAEQRQQLQAQAADEAAAARQERAERLRRGSLWLAAVILMGLLVGLMIGRVVKGVPNLASVRPTVQAAVAARVIEVRSQHDGSGLELQVLLDRPVAYRRSEESGAVSLRLPGAQLEGAARRGRVQAGGRSLSWRVESRGADVQVLLVGLGPRVEVRERLEAAGERWLLRIEVPLAPPAAVAAPSAK